MDTSIQTNNSQPLIKKKIKETKKVKRNDDEEA